MTRGLRGMRHDRRRRNNVNNLDNDVSRLGNCKSTGVVLKMEVWQEKFPEVSFTDKVIVIFEDGTEQTEKHLYLDDDLSHIDWSKVVECFEV